MSKIIIEEYDFSNSNADKSKSEYIKITNFRIRSLAKRNKFYYNAISRMVKRDHCEYWGWSYAGGKEVILAKQIIGKREKIIGFIVFSPSINYLKSKWMSCEIDYWMIDEKFRGQGIGKKLYDAVIDEVKEYSIHNMSVLFDGRDENLRKMYAAMGYVRIDSYRGVKTELEEQMRSSEHLIRWWKIVYDNMYFGEQLVKLVY